MGGSKISPEADKLVDECVLFWADRGIIKPEDIRDSHYIYWLMIQLADTRKRLASLEKDLNE